MRLTRLLLAALLPLAACEELTGLATDPDAPANVTYQLIPSGDPASPAGVLLTLGRPAQRPRQLVQRVRTLDAERPMESSRDNDVADIS